MQKYFRSDFPENTANQLSKNTNTSSTHQELANLYLFSCYGRYRAFTIGRKLQTMTV